MTQSEKKAWTHGRIDQRMAFKTALFFERMFLVYGDKSDISDIIMETGGTSPIFL